VLKVLLVLAAVAIGLYLLRSRAAGRGDRERGGERGPEAARPEAPARPAPMLACAHCGLHLPAADALRDAEGHAFCSDGHRRAGPRA
jgi:uncharacterized protein